MFDSRFHDELATFERWWSEARRSRTLWFRIQDLVKVARRPHKCEQTADHIKDFLIRDHSRPTRDAQNNTAVQAHLTQQRVIFGEVKTYHVVIIDHFTPGDRAM